ncbi:MAG TPA: flavodoxin-dependent (E)-4-hydroxy-3-methylbut-2-enyl-diphosphate synthase [Pseudonocardiaceae bacterium]|nr:flavodoxin-dependent (E)-4-hydroxy-3-methylbut-2-enyl-diphosphate synthase [Pseudonocardiaceae bacterium]
MTTVQLGMPAPPAVPNLPAPRRRVSRQVMVGGVPVGGDAPVSVQSMTTTRTCDIDATLQQMHLGVTEAGPHFQGTIKSAVAFGVLLAEGIGDTLRVSLPAPPVEEVKVGHQILESLGLRPRHLEIVSCPSCGRAQVDVYTLTEQVTAAFDGFPVPLRIAVMGCVVNGPGEAREADLGVSAGNGKGQIFIRGKIIKTVPEHQIVHTLLNEVLHRDWSHGDGRVKQ